MFSSLTKEHVVKHIIMQNNEYIDLGIFVAVIKVEYFTVNCNVDSNVKVL